jgi:cyanophycin synthetase
VDIAGCKEWTKQVLAAARIPVPDGVVVSTEAALQEAVKTIGFPVVIKPLNGNQGKGVTTHVRNRAEMKFAFNKARQYGEQVICEKHITGYDYRVLIINNRFVAAAKRTPASVTGDGIHTINELISLTNDHWLRGDGHDNYLTRITIDQATQLLLQKQKVTLHTIPAPGTIILLKPTANLSTGGTATDVTLEVHPDNIALFERVARLIGLDVCGIDVMAESLRTRLTENGGAILEVNAAPGLRMHLLPSAGQSRNVAAPIIDMLFPENAPGRIPVFAVTGTNGKTTTTRIIAGILHAAGYYTGFTTTDGIYIGHELVSKGDCSGPVSARLVLQDPAVEAAVLECARGGILRSGLGFDHCDVAVITNIAEDHLGLDGIDTIKDLARVKAVVAKSVKATGTAVLNADNELTPGIMKELDGNIALFSLCDDNPVIKAHVQAGGMAVTIKDRSLILYRDHQAVCLEAVNNIPGTFNGKATFNVANAMAAALACISYGIPLHIVCQGLQQFAHSPEHTPGRMNLFTENGYTVLLDYAHNPHGLQAVGSFISQMDCNKKIGIITGVGDRRNEDIIRMGEEAAKIFDEIIIREDDDLRGRASGEVDMLIRKGIQTIAPGKPVVTITSEKRAIEFGLKKMHPNYLLVMFVDHVWEGIDLVRSKLKAPAVRQMNSSIAV